MKGSTGERLNHIADETDAGQRVDRVLAVRFPVYSRTQIQRAIESNSLRVNGRAERASYRLREHDQIVIELARSPGPDTLPQAESIPLEIVFEDNDLIVVNKPAGMVVHPAVGHRSGTLVNALLGRGVFDNDEIGAQNRPGIVHRLDKGTSGLIVCARTESAHRHLAEQIKSRTLRRSYWAICWGHLKSRTAVFAGSVGRSARDHKRMAVTARGRTAKTIVNALESFLLADLIEATLDTGRTHQIRVHLSHAGHPLVGDADYGGGMAHLRGVDPNHRPLGKRMIEIINRPALHARQLALVHPRDGRPLEFTVDPPPDFQALLDLCRTGDT